MVEKKLFTLEQIISKVQAWFMSKQIEWPSVQLKN